jgi:WD40 repeat protein
MKNVFVGVNSEGVALHCHATSSKLIHEYSLPE